MISMTGPGFEEGSADGTDVNGYGFEEGDADGSGVNDNGFDDGTSGTRQLPQVCSKISKPVFHSIPPLRHTDVSLGSVLAEIFQSMRKSISFLQMLVQTLACCFPYYHTAVQLLICKHTYQ